MSLPSSCSVFHASAGWETGGWGNVVIPSGWVERSEKGLPPSFTPIPRPLREVFANNPSNDWTGKRIRWVLRLLKTFCLLYLALLCFVRDDHVMLHSG
ncbi:hypothetical protein AVEN_136564-1 [Araneus ventricosus]|uniref:Uncharacterized protein n=1 Tax=Araneus ventricosus TaxID=182803 RepID=A0A4Y2GSS2_ARAVE|nr:hypothetical protein AVEN_136564-1 [Araneus ventricosus]